MICLKILVQVEEPALRTSNHKTFSATLGFAQVRRSTTTPKVSVCLCVDCTGVCGCVCVCGCVEFTAFPGQMTRHLIKSVTFTANARNQPANAHANTDTSRILNTSNVHADTQSPPPGRVCGVIDPALFPRMQKESIRLPSRQPYFPHAGFLY